MAEEETKEETAEGEASAEAPVEAAERPAVIEPWSWMTDWFDDWPRVFGRRFPESFWRAPSGEETFRVEQYVDGDDMVVRAELPGVDPEEAIDVSVTGDKLTIAARREQREESKSDEGFRSEFHYGAFRRVMSLPPGTSADDVTANYDDGILEVRLPVEETKEAKTKVTVKRGS